jgi:hypothetical protein
MASMATSIRHATHRGARILEQPGFMTSGWQSPLSGDRSLDPTTSASQSGALAHVRATWRRYVVARRDASADSRAG